MVGLAKNKSNRCLSLNWRWRELGVEDLPLLCNVCKMCIFCWGAATLQGFEKWLKENYGGPFSKLFESKIVFETHPMFDLMRMKRKQCRRKLQIFAKKMPQRKPGYILCHRKVCNHPKPEGLQHPLQPCDFILARSRFRLLSALLPFVQPKESCQLSGGPRMIHSLPAKLSPILRSLLDHKTFWTCFVQITGHWTFHCCKKKHIWCDGVNKWASITFCLFI